MLLTFIYKNKDDRVGGEKIKEKGIRSHVVKNHMTLEDHRKCVFVWGSWSGGV